jgi:hypothetical protein
VKFVVPRFFGDGVNDRSEGEKFSCSFICGDSLLQIPDDSGGMGGVLSGDDGGSVDAVVSAVLEEVSDEDCELLRRTITGLFFLTATGLFLLTIPEVAAAFFSVLELGEPGEGGCTVTCELKLADDIDSSSDSCGEMKRAVGRGPVVEGPLDFLSMGCGITEGALDVVDEDVVLGRPWCERLTVVELEPRGPARAVLS